MTLEELMMHVEALIFASEKAITPLEITTILAEQYPEAEINEEKISQAVEALVEKFGNEFYSFEIKEIGGGLQFLTKSKYYQTIAKLNGNKFLKRLSTAAMETLSIIAYKQPITKPEIEFIRGVNCDYSIQKLLEKEIIFISGRNEEGVGKPLLYSTTKSFMDFLGINSIDDLPKLKEMLSDASVTPTNANEALPENETTLVVDEGGELIELPSEEIAEENPSQEQDNNSKENPEQNS